MIYNGLILVIDFLSYYLIYRVIFRALFVKRFAWKVLALFGSLAVTEAYVCLSGQDGASKIIALVCFISVILLLKEQRVYGLLLFPVVFLISGSVNIFSTYLLSYLLKIPYDEYMSSSLWKFVAELPPFFILILMYYFYGRKDRGDMISLGIPRYLLVLIGSASLFMLVGISQGFMLGRSEAYKMMRFFAVYSVIAVIAFTVLFLWQVFIERMAIRYQQENELYRSYLEKQEMHIHDIIEADQKIRRFRHDIKAHVIAIETEIENGDLESLKRYVLRMKEESEKGFIDRYTGIAAVDAVIGEWHQKALDQNVKWTWEGDPLPQSIESTFELCVIFSNLLSNAVEAASCAPGEKKVDLYCGSTQGSVLLRVSNTCDPSVTLDQISKTTKADGRNHGFGLKNVQAMVDEMKGSFRKNVKDGVFEAEVIL